MSCPLGIALAGLAMLVGASSTYAASGRVMFSGAVAEPTCSTPILGVVVHTVAVAVTRRLGCGRTAAEAGSTYSREVLDLATAKRYHDRLLDYFASYAGSDAAKVVVHTYD